MVLSDNCIKLYNFEQPCIRLLRVCINSMTSEEGNSETLIIMHHTICKDYKTQNGD